MNELLQRAKRSIPCLESSDSFEIEEGVADGPGPASRSWSGSLRAMRTALKSQGVTLGVQLGCGTYGCAFEARRGSSELVVKVTGDAAEAAAAQAVLTAIAEGRTSWERLDGLGRLTCVYGLQHKGKKGPIYSIFQEKLHPLVEEDVAFINRYRWSFVIGHEELEKLALAALGARGRENARRVQRVRAELERCGVSWNDIHGGNLLADARGRWTVIDLGASNNRDRVRVPLL